MKGTNTWSYAPYKPLLRNVGDIYICRIVPSADKIHFEWLDIKAKEYIIFFKKRTEENFSSAGKTNKCEFDIENLISGEEYEFFVESDSKKSRVRLARCGNAVGTVVNYLHPDDDAYSFSGKYLCSPSLLKHPDGYLLASMDLFAGGYPQNLTLIYRSDDNGKTWHYVSELMPCFWGKMFIHKGELYMLSCNTEYGDLLIGKSSDGGKNFSAPVVLLRGSNGKNGNDGVHKNPQNIFIHNGRIYETLEWGTWVNPEFEHAAMVMSCSIDDDLLIPENWSFSEPKTFSPDFSEKTAGLPKKNMTIEGTLTTDTNGTLVNVMRFGNDKGYALVYKVNSENHDAPLEYLKCINFPAHYSKFMIKYDSISQKYYSVATRIYDKNNLNARNLLSLMSSSNLNDWDVVCDLFDKRNCDVNKVGFQYVDFEFDGDDIIFLCRTAINGAHNYHDSNYSTFHRIKNFRENPQL